MKLQTLAWTLWPSFVVGGIAEGLFFTVFDPLELVVFGQPVTWSRIAVYSVGFFAFWAVCAASSAFTCYLSRRSDQVNRRT
jgi:hypothetical protein